MNFKRFVLLLPAVLILMFFVLLSGCRIAPPSRDDTPASIEVTEQSQEKPEFSAEQETTAPMPVSDSEQLKKNKDENLTPEASEASEADKNNNQSDFDISNQVDSEALTPYQLLNLFVGNADEISFDYTVYEHQTGQTDTGSFYKSGEKSACIFTTKDMNGNTVTIRALEMDGFVHYIMADPMMIKSYLAPAEDFILYEMMIAAKTVPDKALEVDGYLMFEHSLPFVQDETINVQYRFYMKENALKKLECLLDNSHTLTYEFSEFKQEADDSVFVYPEDYFEQQFDYPNTWELCHPGEIGNDA